MRSKGQFYLGLIVVILGLLLLVGRLTHVNMGRYFWPLLLIGTGVWLVARPRMVGPDTRFSGHILGDIRREGAWAVTDEEIWLGIGDVKLDLSAADVSEGDTNISVYVFVGDVELVVPEDVGVSIAATSFVTDAHLFGQKEDHFVSTTRLNSDNYDTVTRRIRLQTTFFVNDLKVRRG